MEVTRGIADPTSWPPQSYPLHDNYVISGKIKSKQCGENMNVDLNYITCHETEKKRKTKILLYTIIVQYNSVQ